MTADFNRLLDILMPSQGVVAVFEAYFDESERKSGLFSVAGYAFTKVQAKAFNRQWSALFGSAGCHMKELTARRGRFDGITSGQADTYIRGAVQIINRRAAYGVAVSCHLAEMKALLPRFVVKGRG